MLLWIMTCVIAGCMYANGGARIIIVIVGFFFGYAEKQILSEDLCGAAFYTYIHASIIHILKVAYNGNTYKNIYL